MKNNHSTIRHLSLATSNAVLPVRLLQNRILHGCNAYHSATVIRQRIDLGTLAGLRSSAGGPGFASRFTERFVGLEKMTPEGHMNDDFLQRLNQTAGAPFVEVLFEAILAVEASMAFTTHNLAPLSFATILPTRSPAWHDMIWACSSPKISSEAAIVACTGLVELLPKRLQPTGINSSTSFFTRLAALKKLARRRQRSLTAEVLALAAKERGLPCMPVGDAYLQLGHGIAQHVIHDSFNGSGPSHEEERGEHVNRMKLSLYESELPMTRQWPAETSKEAIKIANTIGYPVFLKPQKGRQLSRMSLCVRKAEDVPKAFAQARRDYRGVMVQQFVTGQSHRLLVIGGRFVAALHMLPITATGDGVHTIHELIDELNNDPLRNGISQTKIPVDWELVQSLKFAGKHLLDVPENGEEVELYAVATNANGATRNDVTDIVHSENQFMAIKAAASKGLRIAGIDFVTPDITSSYREVGGSIIEINSCPDLFTHVWPRHGKSRDVGREILKLAFPRGGNGRIPIILVAGDKGANRLASDLDTMMLGAHKSVALALKSGSQINGAPLEHESSKPRSAAQQLLLDPRAEVLISTVSPKRVIRHGLGIEQCDVAAILDPAPNTDIDIYCQGIEVVMKATRGTLVVSATNRAALELIARDQTHQLVLISSSPRDSIIQSHLQSGRVAVMGTQLNGRGYLVLQRKDKTIASFPVASLISARGQSLTSRDLSDRMFALGMAYASGLSVDQLQSSVSKCAPLNLTA